MKKTIKIKSENFLKPKELKDLLNLDFSRLSFMRNNIVKNIGNIENDNLERIKMIQNLLKEDEHTIYNIYTGMASSLISKNVSNQDIIFDFNNIFIPLLILAMYNNKMLALKTNKIEENFK